MRRQARWPHHGRRIDAFAPRAADRELYLFDTFNGMAPPTDVAVNGADHFGFRIFSRRK
jgi:hypothetical protein